MADAEETVTISIEDDAGETDRIELPAGLLERVAEPGEPAATVVADVALMSFTGRAHAMVHHDEGEPDPALGALEEDMLDRFEERFGLTYAEATGHAH